MHDSDELMLLYHGLTEGNPIATRRFVNSCLPRLRSILKREHLYAPRETIEDAAVDAVMVLIRHPNHYEPQRGSLLNFLTGVAGHRILDALRKERRERLDFVGGSVELELVETKHYREEAERPEAWHDPDTLSEAVEALIREILPDPTDRAVLGLIIQGRGDTDEYAAALGLLHLPPAERKAQVKRHRDRVLKKIQRRRAEFQDLL